MGELRNLDLKYFLKMQKVPFGTLCRPGTPRSIGSIYQKGDKSQFFGSSPLFLISDLSSYDKEFRIYIKPEI